MAFSLQQFKAYGIRTSGATRQHCWQAAELGIVALNTDTALDISSDTNGSLGTFWTAATGNATYGTLASGALSVVQNIVSICSSLKNVESESLMVRTKLVSGQQKVFTSAASAGGAATENYTVTGLLATDTVISVTPFVAAATRPETIKFLSAAYGGGSATPTFTVTGLLSTDTILSVVQTVANANSLPLLAYGSPGAGTLAVTYSADPGASGKITVTVQRSSGAGFVPDSLTPVSFGTPTANTLPVTYGADPGAGAKVVVVVNRTAAAETATTGTYTLGITGHLPNIGFASGDAPTSQLLRLVWTLQDGMEAYVADYGAAF